MEAFPSLKDAGGYELLHVGDAVILIPQPLKVTVLNI